jgi:hypothetical protein
MYMSYATGYNSFTSQYLLNIYIYCIFCRSCIINCEIKKFRLKAVRIFTLILSLHIKSISAMFALTCLLVTKVDILCVVLTEAGKCSITSHKTHSQVLSIVKFTLLCFRFSNITVTSYVHCSVAVDCPQSITEMNHTDHLTIFEKSSE